MPASEIVYVLVALLGVAMLVTGICRGLPIPYTVVLVMIGMVLGNLAHTLPFLEALQDFTLSPEIMLFVFLPALIFESGFALDARQMLKDLPPILMLAIPAMLMSTFVVGLGVWWILDVKLIVALVFGALISATDPVAVVALFKELGAPNRLNVLVEGESLLNDATAIVTFSILLGIALEGGGIGWSDVDNVIVEFLRVFIGGALFGGLLGFLVCELLYRMRSNISVILTTSIIIAYASFVVAEHTLHVSGVMAVVGAAIALGRFGVTRFRQDTTHSISEVWEVIALCCNSLLFLLVGLSISIGTLFSQIEPILIAVGLVLTARALSVYGLPPVAVRWFNLPHISLGERHIMWWGGLKGGLAIAVVLSIPADLPERQFLFELTLGVVLFTLLVSAPTIRPLMELLGLNEATRGEDLERRNSLNNARNAAKGHLSRLAESKVVSRTAVAALLERIREAFSGDAHKETEDEHDNDEYFATFRAYRAERETLKTLYETGVIGQYIYLDMSNQLHALRESLRIGESQIDRDAERREQSLFERIEGNVLGRIRENRWLGRSVSHYQETRMVQQVQRKLATILLCDSVTDMLRQQDDLDVSVRKKLITAYKLRKKDCRTQLKLVKQQHPQFYEKYTERLTTRSMINSGWNQVKSEFHSGDLSAKGYNLIEHSVDATLKQVEKARLALSESDRSISEFLGDVELFSPVSEDDKAQLESHASLVTFLAGDTIIGVHQTGDYFYVLVQGTATVWITDAFNRQHFMAEFKEGDFMGESSLLARQRSRKHKRSATVKAETPCTLIRIAPEAMSSILWKYPGILKTLKTVNETRLSVVPKGTDKLRVYEPGSDKKT